METSEQKVLEKAEVDYGSVEIEIDGKSLDNLRQLAYYDLKDRLTNVSMTVFNDAKINDFDDLVKAIGEATINNLIETSLKAIMDEESKKKDEKSEENIQKVIDNDK